MQKFDSVSCGDDFTAAATLSDVLGSTGGGGTVSGNDAFIAIQYAPARGQETWTEEVHAPVGGVILAAGTTGVRFRNYVAGKVAVVSANLSFRSEPPITFTAAGQSSVTPGAGTYLGAFTWATLPITTTVGDFALLSDAWVSQGGLMTAKVSKLMKFVNSDTSQPWEPADGTNDLDIVFEKVIGISGPFGPGDYDLFTFPAKITVRGDVIGGAGGQPATIGEGTAVGATDIVTTNIAANNGAQATAAATTTFAATTAIHFTYTIGAGAVGLVNPQWRFAIARMAGQA